LLIFIMRTRSKEDNSGMNKEPDLLPWILGGLSIAVAAAAIGFVNSRTARAVTAQAAAPTMAQTSIAASAPASAPVAAPTPAPDLAAGSQGPQTQQPPTPPMPAPMLAGAEPPTTSGQIWECTTNGVKTFSNNPCGDKSTLVAMRAINTMNAAPPPQRYPRYGAPPAYSTQYADPSAYADQDSYADQDEASGYAGNSYAVIGGFRPLLKRREHSYAPPPHHNSGPPPRRN
jgi:hypothetical protein